ncbi:hypothetical protein Mp_3g19180 [Marchantia polymorpha subsp. ruderalis]|uniref:Uncharacterized protein n=2 Tax=Marchantia polymorpha TaxID=3197 RepID=A0AAF6B2G7_MARPO|nr:hypothetical protein MARPO_0049s0116 [Marchantia polymorpha]BBN06201.1 hypothetical protein Mp_3g19180 [Marchantia polymorpha subsp. ruderalis]|eukprot:PTQ38842.1 hypothetical protein MARPO_0049s0116 [Marchantia polymorpha]
MTVVRSYCSTQLGLLVLYSGGSRRSRSSRPLSNPTRTPGSGEGSPASSSNGYTGPELADPGQLCGRKIRQAGSRRKVGPVTGKRMKASCFALLCDGRGPLCGCASAFSLRQRLALESMMRKRRRARPVRNDDGEEDRFLPSVRSTAGCEVQVSNAEQARRFVVLRGQRAGQRASGAAGLPAAARPANATTQTDGQHRRFRRSPSARSLTRSLPLWCLIHVLRAHMDRRSSSACERFCSAF